MRQKEIDLAKSRGEQLAKLKHQKEMLELDHEKIMQDLDSVKRGDLQALRKNEASRWAANDIVTAKGNGDLSKLKMNGSMRNKIIDGQAKINKLKEERSKIEKEAFPYIDELDILQKQYEDKDFNQKTRMLANDLDERNIRPDLKANQMEFMRRQIEQKGGPSNDFLDDQVRPNTNHRGGPRSRASNYDNSGNANVQNVIAAPVPPPVVGPMAATMPGAIPGMPGVFPGALGFPGMPGMPGAFGHGAPFAPPLAPFGANNPNVAFLKAQIDKQEEENKKIEDDLLNNGKL